MNKFDEFSEAVSEAQETQRAADRQVSRMAEMCVGKLRRINYYTLDKLKKELKDYNMHTGKWKS